MTSAMMAKMMRMVHSMGGLRSGEGDIATAPGRNSDLVP